MLAKSAEDLAAVKFPVLASPKLDGVRAIVIDGVLMSRSLKPIPNAYAQKLFSKLPNGTDGELIVGPANQDPYRKTVSAVMSEDGENEDLHYYVFDNYLYKGGFQNRFADVKQIVRAIDPYHVVIVPHMLIKNVDDLTAAEESFVSQGYEGAMIRSLDGPYKFGRATVKEGYLLKIKRFVDSEAEVIGYYELMHNENEAETNELGRTERSSKKEGLVGAGTLGGFEVEDLKGGVRFRIGSGFTAAEREDYWKRRSKLIGLFIKYKYFPMGSKDRPRHPIYLGPRDKRDL
jgi:DNA ligase-1